MKIYDGVILIGGGEVANGHDVQAVEFSMGRIANEEFVIVSTYVLMPVSMTLGEDLQVGVLSEADFRSVAFFLHHERSGGIRKLVRY